jgi:hypothetical protein
MLLVTMALNDSVATVVSYVPAEDLVLEQVWMGSGQVSNDPTATGATPFTAEVREGFYLDNNQVGSFNFANLKIPCSKGREIFYANQNTGMAILQFSQLNDPAE